MVLNGVTTTAVILRYLTNFGNVEGANYIRVKLTKAKIIFAKNVYKRSSFCQYMINGDIRRD